MRRTQTNVQSDETRIQIEYEYLPCLPLVLLRQISNNFCVLIVVYFFVDVVGCHGHETRVPGRAGGAGVMRNGDAGKMRVTKNAEKPSIWD